ncbi:alpha/beta fold hydrolase [Dankookia sp. GCM10030260]|uniref:alpha/beta fold hydrolase n=1 Tax=Dankookia sp. GCM10030260 TaxID=3273390 RepID=UPI0036125178
MRTSVYFITNRAAGPAGAPPAEAFGPLMVGMEVRTLSCGVAFVTNTTPDPATLEQRRVEEVVDVTPDMFSATTLADILGSGKNLLFFVHGFANSFADAMARAAFNREWFAASGLAEADCTVIAFTWPSAGRVVDGEDVIPGVATVLLSLLGFALDRKLQSPLANRYKLDQSNARSSGRDLARTLDRLAPLVRQVRAQGRKVFLLAHSMGHVALEGAFAGWATSGQSPGMRFDEAVLAAADSDFAFAGHAPPWLEQMPKLADRTSVYVSKEDQILMVSEAVNAIQRLGEKGPPDQADAAVFPPGQFCFVDCSRLQDAVAEQEIDHTHQYYRRIAAVRDDIAMALAGTPRPGQVVLGG